ncbi:MAG TPA: TonB-dependent receptor plug domain-containing protein [Xanthomonadaceae bacterium]|nr:TonB-dependent receptor plug domain-containing protein [Xanthomonadaceae bacterium]
MHPSLRRLSLAAALLACPPFALGQEAAAPATPVPASDARTYVPADFARYAPRNALDMLEQVPGFVIREAVVERGLGQATGNVLLNGQRLSGKSNDVITQLSQVPADDVVRIEIVDGATLEIPGLSGQVANVVTDAEGLSGQWEWKPDFRSYYTNPQFTRTSASVSGSRGRLDYTLGFENGANHSGAGGPTTLYNADGSVREHRDEAWTGEVDAPRLSTQLAWKGATGAVGNLNASWQKVFYDYVEDGTRAGPGLPDRIRSVRSEQGGHNYEVGGDYEFGLGTGRLKLIGLSQFDHTPTVDTVEVAYADGSPTEGFRFTRDGETTERIARAEYRWTAGGDWQVSGEYAFNRLDSISALFQRAADGSYQPVPLPGGTATVQEDRYELMGSYGRTLTPDLTLQVAAGAEDSTIEQAGGGGLRRSFRRPKGQVSLAWEASDALDVNTKLQRRVGQLDFYDFLASVDLADDQVNAGNPDLVPPQLWVLEVEAIRDLGDWGSTSVRGYAQRIDDIVDTVPIGATGESPGNIDSARVHGIEWKSTLRLEPIGWAGARLDTRLQVQRSSVRDPLTGEERPISNYLQELAEVSLRHDVPGTDWAWGGNLSYVYAARDYRLTEVGRMWEGPVWDSWFVEHKDVAGMTVRAGVTNLVGARSMWQRTVYVDRRDGPVDYYEDRDRRIGPIFQFTVSGKF